MKSNPTRDAWAGRLGIILAAAGSAVGLGNLLRFPSIAATNGGGAFIIPYFLAFLLLGLPMCWVEWTMGRYGGQYAVGDAPGIIRAIAAKPRWLKYFGIIGTFGPLGISFYYLYIESWSLAYAALALLGTYRGIDDPEAMNRLFVAYIHSPWRFLPFAVTFGANFLILYRGVSRGIERLCRISMPVLILAGLVIAGKVLFLGAPIPGRPEWNVSNGFGFLWNPDFSQLLSPKIWLAAASQIFFSLSIGIGCLMTYASYLRRDDDVALGSTTAAMLNELIEVVIGASIIIPAAFCFFGPVGTQQAIEGGMFGLGFRTMPLIFNHVGYGAVLGVVWFSLLFVAGLTSTVSMIHPSLAFFEERLGLTRKRAVAVVGGMLLAGSWLSMVRDYTMDELDFWFSMFSLPLFACIELFVFLRYIGPVKGWCLLHEAARLRIPRVFRFVLTWITPVILAGILLSWAATDGWRRLLLIGVPEEQRFWIVVVRVGYVALFGFGMFLVKRAYGGGKR
ncbi:MAG: sodium-dependent transporter [Kiritimatiellia bacterium]|nr:sodium-dependent transporter [Kiritimatiellia bacterium]